MAVPSLKKPQQKSSLPDSGIRRVKILVASPGDVLTERKIVEQVIKKWNILHSEERKLVLDAVLWESHTASESGERTQGIINRQIVDQCDFAIGIFWTRIGTPTGVAPGGAVEEVERMIASGKQVMLYFSDKPIAPSAINAQQRAKIDEFRASIQRNALVAGYKKHTQFHEKLADDIFTQVRRWYCHTGEDEIDLSSANQVKMSAPKAFIAYSWEDESHKKWVADLATRLRHNGIETILDQWHAVLGDQLPDFMEKEIRNNDFVLIICTPKYRSKCDNRDGGAGYEGDIMTAEVFTTKNHRKFIPVLAKGSWDEAAPSWLKGKFYLDLSTPKQDERNYPRLIDALLHSHPEPPPVMPRIAAIPPRQFPITPSVVIVENRQQLFQNTNEQNAEYILIPGGSYLYSATKKEEHVSDLYFAKYPVTNQRYRDFIRFLQSDGLHQGVSLSISSLREELKAIAKRNLWWSQLGDYLHDGKNDLAALFLSSFDADTKFNGNNQPVVGVTWYAASAYCLWLSMLEGSTTRYRLPTAIEWEWAAGGKRETIPQKVRDYPWPDDEGDISVRLANYNGNVGATTPVGSYPDGATPEGLYDMAGNVWEGTDSWWDEKTRSFRVLRGGSWNFTAEYCRSADRGGDHPGGRSSGVGFRLVFVP